MALMVPGSRMPMDRDDNGGAAGRREPRADRHGRGPRREGRHAARHRGGCGAPAVQPDWVQAPNDVTARRETTERPSRPCVVSPEVLGDRPERPTAPTHLSRLGGDALEHRDGWRIPQLDLERHRSQGSQSLRACPVHRDGQRPGGDPGAAEGPARSDRGARVHGRGEGRHRAAQPVGSATRGGRADRRRLLDPAPRWSRPPGPGPGGRSRWRCSRASSTARRRRRSRSRMRRPWRWSGVTPARRGCGSSRGSLGPSARAWLPAGWRAATPRR